MPVSLTFPEFPSVPRIAYASRWLSVGICRSSTLRVRFPITTTLLNDAIGYFSPLMKLVRNDNLIAVRFGTGRRHIEAGAGVFSHKGDGAVTCVSTKHLVDPRPRKSSVSVVICLVIQVTGLV